MNNYFLSWWNVENLFDVESADRSPKLARTIGNELKGWTQSILDKKIDNLSSVIQQMNNGNGPDLLGLCEVENRRVIELLIEALSPLNRNFDIIHQDTKDDRGIDVAFIYDKDVFRLAPEPNVFSLEVMKRLATRDMLQVNFELQQSGRLLIVIGNHWPSRRGGQYETEPYRIMVGEVMSYWMQRIQQVYGQNTAVVSMGDFNDEPFSRAVTDYALSVNSVLKVANGVKPYQFNLMYPFTGANAGTFVYGADRLMFDQFMISQGMVRENPPLRVDPASVRIEIYEGMAKGLYTTPVKFGRPSQMSSFNAMGFSDHFPISLVMLEDQ